MQFENTISIGKNAKPKQDFEFVAEVSPKRYIRCVMTEQEHGMLSRVIRRAYSETADINVIKEED